MKSTKFFKKNKKANLKLKFSPNFKSLTNINQAPLQVSLLQQMWPKCKSLNLICNLKKLKSKKPPDLDLWWMNTKW